MIRHDLTSAVAAHRFGLGEPRLDVLAGDPLGWLAAQIGPADPQQGSGLPSGLEGLLRHASLQRQQRQQAQAGASMAAEASPAATDARPGVPPEVRPARGLLQLAQTDVRARLLTAATSTRPFNERLALFWANHFTVSLSKGSTRGLVGAFEREAIRPHIAGGFEVLLKAAVQHAGMLRYLDNDNSAGPDSVFVQGQARWARARPGPAPRISGLNENLAREVLELHTLGVDGGYSQADVTEFARVLTGWRVPQRELADAAPGTSPVRFEPSWHQPGVKTVLGQRHGEGPDALDAVLHQLARHASTARFIATKLARHFVADQPPPALVARLEASYRRSDGDLPSLYRTLIEAPEAWSPQPTKLKSPEEFVISAVRLLEVGEQVFARSADAGIGQLGQRVQAAPSPAGWPDRAEEWLGPDAVWKRVEWATRIADRLGRQVDARQLAQQSLGPLLQDSTAVQIERAADGPQALALLLLAPEFQRR